MSIDILRDERNAYLARAREVYKRFGIRSPRVLNAIHFARELNRAIIVLRRADAAGLL